MIYRLLGKMMYDSPDIKNRVSSRIYFEYAPELKKIPLDQRGPCIVIRKVSGTAETHLQNECDKYAARMQIDCYDSTPTNAESLNELVRLKLSGFGPATVEGVLGSDGNEHDIRVDSIIRGTDGMYTDEPRDGSDKWTHRYLTEYEVFHSQSVPTHV